MGARTRGGLLIWLPAVQNVDDFFAMLNNGEAIFSKSRFRFHSMFTQDVQLQNKSDIYSMEPECFCPRKEKYFQETTRSLHRTFSNANILNLE